MGRPGNALHGTIAELKKHLNDPKKNPLKKGKDAKEIIKNANQFFRIKKDK